MDGHYPPPDFATSIHEMQFRQIEERFGSSLHDIVSAHGAASDDEIWFALNSVVYWKTAKNKEFTKSQRMVSACADLYAAVNSSGFQKYFETEAGNGWPYIYEILELGDDAVALAAFSDVLAVFPNGKPSTRLTRRLDQMNSIQVAQQQSRTEIFRHHDKIREPLDYPSNAAVWRSLLARPDERYIPPVT